MLFCDMEKGLQTSPIGYFSCNKKILLRILATLPVSSATAERLFSTLRLIKLDLQTNMGQIRLDGLYLMHMYIYNVYTYCVCISIITFQLALVLSSKNSLPQKS